MCYVLGKMLNDNQDPNHTVLSPKLEAITDPEFDDTALNLFDETVMHMALTDNDEEEDDMNY